MIKRYEISIYPGEMEESPEGNFIEYADHAALIAKVREIAEGMEHDESCDAYDYDDFDYDEYGSPAKMFKPKCRPAVCTRGKLLEVINGRD